MFKNIQGSLKMIPLNLGKRIYRGFYNNQLVVKTITNQFHQLFYHTPSPIPTWGKTTWLGVGVYKCPFDLWVYQEMLFDLKPDLIIECGTNYGGSAFYLASLCDLLGKGRIITIDIEEKSRPTHSRITYLTGSSISPETLARVRTFIQPDQTVLVLLDSDHSMAHVLKEMRHYGPLVSLNSYMVVEDSNINGHPVAPLFGPGPMEAIKAFLQENDTFVVDKEKEKFFLTFNPSGYLKRIK